MIRNKVSKLGHRLSPGSGADAANQHPWNIQGVVCLVTGKTGIAAHNLWPLGWPLRDRIKHNTLVRIQYGDFQKRRIRDKGDRDIVRKEDGPWIRWTDVVRLKTRFRKDHRL